MDYSKKVFEMLGVEQNEVFGIKGEKRKYQIDRFLDVVVSVDKDCEIWESSDIDLSHLLNGTHEIVKIPQLTEIDRKAIDYLLAVDMPWIAKDRYRAVYAYCSKPTRHTDVWWVENSVETLQVSNKCFKFLSWEDEEPTDLRTL